MCELRVGVVCDLRVVFLTNSDSVSAGSCEFDHRFASVHRTTSMCTGAVLVSCCAVACCVCMLHTLVFGACMRVCTAACVLVQV